MTESEKIREEIAKRAYIWDFMRNDKKSIEPFEWLSEEERKPYFALAYLLEGYFNAQRIIKGAMMYTPKPRL